MNGTLLDEIKKSGDTKKREKFKIIFTLIVSNIFVAILAINLTAPSEKIIPEKNSKTLHPDHKMIILPLKVLIDLNPNDHETAVTLMNKSKKVVIQKAFLHEEVKKSEQLGGLAQFKIEIPEAELLKLSADEEMEMIAMPEIKIKAIARRSNKRVSTYEINL